MALTNDDHVNLKIAITSKLLHRALPVICRGETQDYEANMASFGTDHIIDPFTTFADRLAMALDTPGLFLLYTPVLGQDLGHLIAQAHRGIEGLHRILIHHGNAVAPNMA